jgi:hypothetical protein
MTSTGYQRVGDFTHCKDHHQGMQVAVPRRARSHIIKTLQQRSAKIAPSPLQNALCKAKTIRSKRISSQQTPAQSAVVYGIFILINSWEDPRLTGHGLTTSFCGSQPSQLSFLFEHHLQVSGRRECVPFVHEQAVWENLCRIFLHHCRQITPAQWV